MGLIEISLLIAASWCVVLAFGTALFGAAAKADKRDDALRGIGDSAMVAGHEPKPVASVSRVISA